jgi:hypothetical protein
MLYVSQFPGDFDVVERVEEVSELTPPPVVQRTPRKKHTLDDAHYDALVAEKNKFEAETEKLREEAAMMRAKTAVLNLKQQLLKQQLQAARRNSADYSYSQEF